MSNKKTLITQKFKVPVDAPELIMEVDMYEIDAWESSGVNQDFVYIVINGANIDLGAFAEQTDEKFRDRWVGDIYWKTESYAPQRNIGFSSPPDQKHKVYVKIPPSYYASGEILLGFACRFNSAMLDESLGWDNFKLTAPCSESRHNNVCEQEVIAFYDFENDSEKDEWVNGIRDNQGQANFTKFLGRMARDTQTNIWKIFTVDTDYDAILLEVDMYEIDAWESTGTSRDYVYLIINNKEINLGPFSVLVDEGLRQGVDGDIVWQTQSYTPPRNMGFYTDADQKHKLTVTIPKQYFASGQLRIGFKATMTGDICNESVGWDNFKLTSICVTDANSALLAQGSCPYLFLDFETLVTAQYVTNQLMWTHGVLISAEATSGGYTPGGGARVFNSFNPTSNTELGSPNLSCSGRGTGTGGARNATYENCTPLGNTLIIQESNIVSFRS
jgi:hypothetical protein